MEINEDKIMAMICIKIIEKLNMFGKPTEKIIKEGISTNGEETTTSP